MTSMKHYHLGCGESLQSTCMELRKFIAKTYAARIQTKRNPVPRSKPGKQH